MFYDDQDPLTEGLDDFVSIQDFSLVDDIIQLSGAATDYVLGSTSDNQSTEIRLVQNTDELIAVVEQVSLTSFAQGFVFV